MYSGDLAIKILFNPTWELQLLVGDKSEIIEGANYYLQILNGYLFSDQSATFVFYAAFEISYAFFNASHISYDYEVL